MNRRIKQTLSYSMKNRSSSSSRVPDKRCVFSRIRHYSTSSNKSYEFDSFEDDSFGLNSLKRRSSSSKHLKGHLSKNNSSSSSCESEGDGQMRVLFLGAESVGKTSIIRQFLGKQFSSKHQPTLQEMYTGELDLGGSQLALRIEDTGSFFIHDFPAMADVSLKNSDGAVLVFDVNDPKSFEEISKLRDLVFSKRPSLPTVIVGNKIDLERKLPAKEIEFTVCLDWECGYVECSAWEEQGVDGVFRELAIQAKIMKKVPPENLGNIGRQKSFIKRMFRKEAKRESRYKNKENRDRERASGRI